MKTAGDKAIELYPKNMFNHQQNTFNLEKRLSFLEGYNYANQFKPVAVSDEDIEDTIQKSIEIVNEYHYTGVGIIQTRQELRDVLRKLTTPSKQVEGSDSDKWISVNDKLPELDKEVLIICGNHYTIGSRTSDSQDPENHNGWVIDAGELLYEPIKYWQPLPSKPIHTIKK